jgi:methylated-DNA-[protein]-cysteine S-methyltransferase
MSLPRPELDPGHAATLAARVTARAAQEGLVAATYATVDSPVGRLVAVVTPVGLARLAYEDFDGGVDAVLDDVAARLSPAIVEGPLDDLRRELEEYFAGRRRAFGLPIDWALVRTPFTQGVLRATAAIPFGATSTYRDIAAAAGSPAAFRATGNALGSNPIPIVVPCHRVLGSGGRFGGYTGGVGRKRALLAIEGAMLAL